MNLHKKSIDTSRDARSSDGWDELARAARSHRAIRARQAGEPAPADLLAPGIADGLEGMAFVDACVRSSARDGAWTALP